MAGGRAGLVATIIGVGMAAKAAAYAGEGTGSEVTLPDGTLVERVDFERHVAGLFTRRGCNAGSCHGSHDGQGRFKLSLFGQSPGQDFAALVAPESGRVDTNAPEISLVLRKPTLQVDHEGGRRFEPGSWEFNLVRNWIAQGARHRGGSGRIARLNVQPAELTPLSVGDARSVTVHAEFMDGTAEIVTAFADFRVRDERVAEITPLGAMTARGPGATHVIVCYGNTFAALEVAVAYPSAATTESAPLVCSQPAAVNFIDEEINKQLVRLNLTASPPADDTEFLRRTTLDVLGSLPHPDEIRNFTAESDPTKRQRLVERLLSHPDRAAWWASRMCDITACNVDTMEEPAALRPKRAKMWHDWFRTRFAANMPYDELVRGVLCATSRDSRPVEAWMDSAASLEQQAADGFDSAYGAQQSLDLFWRRMSPQGPVPLEDLAELTASAFLGLRMHCARCHQHPFDRWSQRDFAAYAEIFAHTRFGSSTELRAAVNARLEERRQARREGRSVSSAPIPRLQEVFISKESLPLVDAAVGGPLEPRPPGGPAFVTDTASPPAVAAHDTRQDLFAWLTRPDNPYFAKNFVNRIWAKYFGHGLVDPVDSISDSNPPTHRRLLERLAAEFVASGYDIAHIERLVLTSAAYGRSWRAAGNNAADTNQFARWPVRPLAAEVLVDAVDGALETRTVVGADVPSGARAVELAPNRLTDKNVDELMQLLGRGNRKSLCDCDRTGSPTLRRPIYLMSRPDILGADGRLSRLVRAGLTPDAIVNEFYLVTLSRPPDDNERALALAHISQASEPKSGLADIVWALINTREFGTNH